MVTPLVGVVAARVQVIGAAALVQPPAFLVRIQVQVVKSVEGRVAVRVQRRGLRAGVRAPLLRTRRPRRRVEPVRHESVAGPSVQGDAAWCCGRLSADASAAVTAIRAGLDAWERRARPESARLSVDFRARGSSPGYDGSAVFVRLEETYLAANGVAASVSLRSLDQL